MAIKEREYLFSVNKFNEPEVLKNHRAIGMLLFRLILLDPGSDPLHPEMGVGIRNYRYAVGKLDELKTRVQDQIDTYLPCFKSAQVEIVQTPDHLCNIEITIDGVLYEYKSDEAPVKISLEDIAEN